MCMILQGQPQGAIENCEIFLSKMTYGLKRYPSLSMWMGVYKSVENDKKVLEGTMKEMRLIDLMSNIVSGCELNVSDKTL